MKDGYYQIKSQFGYLLVFGYHESRWVQMVDHASLWNKWDHGLESALYWMEIFTFKADIINESGKVIRTNHKDIAD